MSTTKRFPRSMNEAFDADRYNWGDQRVMRAVVPDLESIRGEQNDATRWPFNPPEAASACSEFGHDDPPPRPQTVSLMARIKRKLRALAIKRLRP